MAEKYSASGSVFMAGVLLVVIALPAICGEWAPAESEVNDDEKEADCKVQNVTKVEGVVGKLEAFNEAGGAGTNGYETSGVVGASWDGQLIDPPCNGLAVTQVNSVRHSYTRSPNGENETLSRSEFSFDINTAVEIEGRAINNGHVPWYWQTQATVEEKAPKLTKTLAGETQPINAEWTPAPDPQSEDRVLNTQSFVKVHDPYNEQNAPPSTRLRTVANHQPVMSGHTQGMSGTDGSVVGFSLEWSCRSDGGASTGLHAKVEKQALKLAFDISSEFLAP